MQAKVETKNIAIEKISGLRLPYLSLNGPKSSWPKAIPNIENVSPSCTIETPVLK